MGGIPSNYTVDMSLDLVSPVELRRDSQFLPTGYHEPAENPDWNRPHHHQSADSVS